MAPAGFWRRFAAHTIDMFVMALIAVMIGLAAGVALVLAGRAMPQPGDASLDLVGNLLAIVFGWLYFALQESGWRQATVGKRLMGIEVSDLAGERISFLRATGRYFAAALSYLTLLVGFVMAGFTRRKQALHDIVAGTLVVRTPDASATFGWVLFAGLSVVGAAALALAAMFALPAWQEAQRQAALPPVVRVASDAATAIDRYYAQYAALPSVAEDAGYVPPDGEVMVGMDPDTGRLTVFLRDGSVMLVMTPEPVADSLVWRCEVTPDDPQYYPPQCTP